MERLTTAMTRWKALKTILQDIVVGLCADADGLEATIWMVRVSTFDDTTFIDQTTGPCQLLWVNTLAQAYRAIRSGLGFPMAFLRAPVMVKAAPTLKPKPRIPQFNSHNRSLNLYLPLRRLTPVTPAGITV